MPNDPFANGTARSAHVWQRERKPWEVTGRMVTGSFHRTLDGRGARRRVGHLIERGDRIFGERGVVVEGHGLDRGTTTEERRRHVGPGDHVSDQIANGPTLTRSRPVPIARADGTQPSIELGTRNPQGGELIHDRTLRGTTAEFAASHCDLSHSVTRCISFRSVCAISLPSSFAIFSVVVSSYDHESDPVTVIVTSYFVVLACSARYLFSNTP